MTPFSKTYPNVTYWTESCGWIESGYDDYSQSFIRVLDVGGMLWESNHRYSSIDEAFDELEAALEEIITEIGK
jgi:hypothetical protein